MIKKLDCIYLIDDDYATNLYNSIILEERNLAEKLVVFEKSTEALHFFQEHKDVNGLILLDVNMPILNGWEFLDEVCKSGLICNRQFTILILSASRNPDHIEKSKEYKCVRGYLNKPLQIDELLKYL